VEKIRRYVPEESDQKIDVQAYWKIFWRKKYYFLVPIILSMLISFVGVRRLTPLYESHSMLAIEDQNLLEQTMGRYISGNEERARERNLRYRSIVETRLKSRSFLESVVTDLGIDRSTDLRQNIERQMQGGEPTLSLDELVMRRLVGFLREKVSVQNPNPGFFWISVFDTDANTAYVLASRIGERFIESMRQARLEGIRQAGAFSDEQLAIYKEKLETSEKELSEVRREMIESDVGSNPVGVANLHFAEVLKNTINAQIEQNEIALGRVRRKLVSIFNLVPSTDKLSTDDMAQNYENRMRAYGSEKLLAELAPGENVGGSVDSDINLLAEELRRRISEIVNAEYATFSSEIRPLIAEYFYQLELLAYHRSRANRLQGYIGQHRTNTRRRPFLEREFNRLSSEAETNRSIYQAFLESKTSAQITEAIQNTNLGLRISIIERAERPLSPVKPEPLKIILVALLFGAACGIGAILVTEYIDNSFRTVEEVQRFLKLPVLGTVPKTIASFAWEKRKRGKMILIWAIGIFIFVSVVTGTLYIYERTLREAGIGIRLTESRGG
jgi:uncharacterized protein involved in exopolysaccharide biosynthesis